MRDERNAVDRRTVLQSMAGVVASVGPLSRSGAAVSEEPLGYGAGGYGYGPYPSETTTPTESSEPSAPRAVVGRLGGEQRSEGAWNTVDLSGPSRAPVVIAQGMTANGSHPAHVRVRDVGDTAFSYKFEEWEYLDGRHKYEEVGYVAVPPGMYALADGTPLLAGTVEVTDEWATISFAEVFDEPPVVFAQPQTFNGHQAIVSRVRNVTRRRFEVCVQEEEALGPHNRETVGYVALPAGRTSIDGTAVEVGSTDGGVDSHWTDVPFEGTYGAPSVVAGFQTTNGPDTASIRVRNVGPEGMEVIAYEETSADAETVHVAEDVGYIVFERG